MEKDKSSKQDKREELVTALSKSQAEHERKMATDPQYKKDWERRIAKLDKFIF